MSAYQRFREQVGLPDDFGQERPYVRLAYVDPGLDAGADADVEYDAETGNVSVAISEWSRTNGRVERQPGIARFEFDGATGQLAAVRGDQARDEAIESLMAAVNGMQVVGETAL